MDKKTYLRKLRQLNNEFIEANRRWQDGEIVERFQKKVVIMEAYGVNTVSNCEVSYYVRELLPNGDLGDQVHIYGYEWESIKTTGEFHFYEDLC